MFRIRAYLTDTCLACFDLAVIACCYVAVAWAELSPAQNSLLQDLLAPDRLIGLGFVWAIWLGLSIYLGLYKSRRLDSPFADVGILIKTGLASWVTLESLAHQVPSLSPTTFFLIRFVMVNFVALAIVRSLLRLALREFRRHGHDVKQIVLVTSPELGQRLTAKIEQRAHYGYRILKEFLYVVKKDDAEPLLAEFRSCLQLSHIDDVIVGLPAQANDLAGQLVAECENHGINVRIVPDLFPMIQTDTQVYDLDGIPLVNVRLYPAEYFAYAICKRVFDIAFSLSVLILLSPALLLIALLIRITSPGPLFFTQERVGLNGRKFKMLKFRTMRQDSMLNPDSHWTVPNDPYVTRLGRWLRRSNLDELPQFINVLKGDMSVVGPRPERPFFLERFKREVPEYMARHYVKSGITGWAQVNGWRGDTAIAARVAHDLYYVRNWGMKLDVKILVLTLMRTFFHGNAY
jgi:Undecaprenyl-phosphate glucose phosphotransferase